jgi:hypothetical protein
VTVSRNAQPSSQSGLELGMRRPIMPYALWAVQGCSHSSICSPEEGNSSCPPKT